MQELLTTLLQAVITVAVPILATFAVNFFTAKTAQAKASTENELADKYLTNVNDAVTTAVLYVSQTYTDALKKSGTFTVENQREALKQASAQAKALLTADASKFLTELYGDLNDYLAMKIEAEVKLLK